MTMITETLPCPYCATTMTFHWWDHRKAQIVKLRCNNCRRTWDYRILTDEKGFYTISIVQN
jgi:transposase-like protein